VFGYALLIVIGMSLLAFFVGRRQAYAIAAGGALHSRPVYHGAFVAIWVGLPALILLLLWVALQGTVIDRLLIGTLPSEMTENASPAQISLYLSEIKNVASGQLFAEPAPAIRAAASTYNSWETIAHWAMVAVASAAAIIGLLFARSLLARRFRARNSFENVLTGLMIFCSIVAILTTLGIVASLLYESIRFFSRVPFYEFLFGLRWEPQIAIREDQVAGLGAFGAVPVFLGTIVIASVAMLFATPVGIFTAIYLVEFADDRVRAVVKPLLEILSGIPTVVYGFFAILVVAPFVRQTGTGIGVDISSNSALVAGGVMGIMLIPFISSLADDALKAVPRAMRDGSLAMGATVSETMTKVLIPAALPGIMGGILLALSRAIGETMIVVMAAGLIATLTINPLDSVTTVTLQIITLLTGDTEFDSSKTLAAFALGLVLFVVTLGLNILALSIVRKYREQYD
jgi:phosphate transport system permease protein